MKRELLEEVLRSLIYHGRHFSKQRDPVVLKKSADFIEKEVNKNMSEFKPEHWFKYEVGQELTMAAAVSDYKQSYEKFLQSDPSKRRFDFAKPQMVKYVVVERNRQECYNAVQNSYLVRPVMVANELGAPTFGHINDKYFKVMEAEMVPYPVDLPQDSEAKQK